MRNLELVLCDGAVEIRDVTDGSNPALVWASDDDADFLEDVMRGQEFVDEDDLERVVDYLIDADVMTRAEADAMDDYEETYEPSGNEDSDEDWDDDDAPHRELDDDSGEE